MTGRSKHEGWMALHEADGPEFACVVPGRFPGLAEAGDRARVAKVRLTEVFRQAARSRIVTAAHGINRGAIGSSDNGGATRDMGLKAADAMTATVRTECKAY